MADKTRKLAGTIPIRPMRDCERPENASVGLWAQGGNSFFSNPRDMRTVDPTEREIALKEEDRAIVGYVRLVRGEGNIR